MSCITESQIENLKKFIDAHKNFYVVGHKEPDGDCVSSSLGIASLLDKLNKKGMLEKSKNITYTDATVKIMSALNDESYAQLNALAKELCKA